MSKPAGSQKPSPGFLRRLRRLAETGEMRREEAKAEATGRKQQDRHEREAAAMKAGDRIMLAGLWPATIKAVRTPAEMKSRLPALSEIFDGATEDGADRVAIATLEHEPPENATEVLIHTAAGWETMGGEAIEVEPLSVQN